MLVSDVATRSPLALLSVVLILVLVDVGLGQAERFVTAALRTMVLILVLVDVGLGQFR